MVVFPAPDGPTRAVSVPGSAANEIPFNISPESTVSNFAADSSEASEISSAFGYRNETFLNSTRGIDVVSAVAPGLLVTMGAKSSTSNTRSKETSAVMTSIRIFESAVKGP